ncbi:MAG: ABC transporter permease [Pusillimonas sp.]
MEPIARPEFELEPKDLGHIGDVSRPLSRIERIANVDVVRQLTILIFLGLCWEGYARYLDSALMFPTLSSVFEALGESLFGGELLGKIAISMKVLIAGYACGIAAAAVLTTIAVSSRIGADFLATLTSMFNPLPAIALLPLALLWFGLGTGSLIFIIIHSVLWPVALNTHSGFRSVSETQRMVGMNYGFRGLSYVTHLLIPAALPAILTGLKIGWAFAWRTLIAAELVFGVSSSAGGLGWFIFENRNQLRTDYVFVGLLTVIVIGLCVEGLIFRWLEKKTVRKWGMLR